MAVDPVELERELDKGSGAPLPPNRPQGLLGDTGLQLTKVDDWAPDGTAGLSQESDGGVVLLGIILAYLLFFPLAFLILWRTPVLDVRRKVALGVLMLCGLVAAGTLLFR